MIGLLEETNVYLSSFASFEKRSERDCPSWLRKIRRQAIERFAELGFPTTRMEDWKYTSVAPIAKAAFKPAEYSLNGWTLGRLSEYTYREIACTLLVFVNGHFSRELSSIGALPHGAIAGSLAVALKSDARLVEPHLARYARFEQNAFTALNTGFAQDGGFVYLPEGTSLKGPIHLLLLSTVPGEATVSHPRNLIVVGANSQVSLIESYVGLEDGAYFTNAVTEISAGERSVIEHTKLERESPEGFHVATLEVHQGRESSFVSNSVATGGALARNEINVLFNGEGGDCTLNGLYVTGSDQHVDNHTSIDHAKPHCTSRELYKGILDGKSRGVFNGKIIVRKDAQKTNAHQTNKNLLLSPHSLVNTKPQLEILADDVRCTHGATIGQLDEEALFYMRTRGIGSDAARNLLTYAFASDIVSRIKIQPIQCQLDLMLLRSISRVRA